MQRGSCVKIDFTIWGWLNFWLEQIKWKQDEMENFRGIKHIYIWRLIRKKVENDSNIIKETEWKKQNAGIQK